ncbi:MAG TPA: mechanosensitive ion channel family protein [Candidatus Acidoferrum sp.]|nr:mechanosensitive ion channel family protein [Candidatus Acidoferrum sp.]
MMNSLAKWTQDAGSHAARILVIAVIALVLVRVLKEITKRLVQRAQSPSRIAQMREQQTRTMAGLLYSVGMAVIVAGAILTALPEFGFNVTPVAAIAAVASLALGFGAQNLVKDLINGLFIVFEDQFVIGDLIQANGETGRVAYLTLRRTVLRNASGALVTIPNGLVGQVANLSRDFSQVFVDVTLPGDEPVQSALSILDNVASSFRADPEWSADLIDGPRVLGIESLALDGTVLRTQVRTVLNRKDDVARELRRRIKVAFEESSVPLTQSHKVQLQGSGVKPGNGQALQKEEKWQK